MALKNKVTRDRVTTTDEHGNRIRVIPAAIKGYWQKRKQIIQWMMIALYFVIPFVHVSGHPLFLFDIEHRRASLFGVLFFAHDAPNIFFMAAAGLFTFALLTALFGRIWCGWGCPQTVFIEQIFRPVERLVEGDHIKQRLLDKQPWNADKILKKTIKWLLFTVIASALAHIFLSYFVGTEQVFNFMHLSPMQHPTAFLLMLFMTALVLFDFGWFREQFCLIACPYGRFQSVLMDQHSLFLAYDEKRKDCIECGKCVQVCPTGIDVRNGLQFECIACTACADACDSVMEKIGKPKKLIGYGSLTSLMGKPIQWFRGRAYVYAGFGLVFLSIFLYKISNREEHSVQITRAINAPYQLIQLPGQEQKVINQFNFRIYNMGWDQKKVKLFLDQEALDMGIELIGVTLENTLGSGKYVHGQFFIKAPVTVKQVSLGAHWTDLDFSDVTFKDQINVLKIVGPASSSI